MEKELPKYRVLLEQLREQISQGELKFGEKLPSEKELAARYSMSRQTVRQAVGLLEQEKMVERRHGSGTYVIHNNSVRRPSTGIIGVVSTYMDTYIFPSILGGIEQILSDHEYAMQLSMTHNQVEDERRALQAMLDKNVDGIIIEPTKSGLPNPNMHLYDEIRKQGIPLVFFNASYPEMHFPRVCLDDRLVGQMATRRLLTSGHRDIAGIFKLDDRQGHLRYEGYLEALIRAEITPRSQNIMWYSTEDIPYLEKETDRLRRYLDGCTGVVCYNDQIAFHIIHALRREGMRIPDDLSVVGVDNGEIANICEVPITSLAHPGERLGRRVADNLMRLIVDPTFDATVEFAPELVERESVRDYKPDKY